MAINVDTTALVGCAERFESISSDLIDELDTAATAVKKLYDSWKSPAGTAFRDKYYNFNNSAQTTCSELITSYSKMLRAFASDGYEYVEGRISGVASKFN